MPGPGANLLPIAPTPANHAGGLDVETLVCRGAPAALEIFAPAARRWAPGVELQRWAGTATVFGGVCAPEGYLGRYRPNLYPSDATHDERRKLA
jgi:hypothetical protein